MSKLYTIGRKTLPYTEVKCSSYYSFLQAASSPQDLIRSAIKLGLNGLALTDVGGVYGLPRAYHQVQEMRREPENFFDVKDSQGFGSFQKSLKNFQLLCGAELLIRPEMESSLLKSISIIAPHRNAYGALCRLLTESHRLRPKGTGDLSFSEFQAWCEKIPFANELVFFPQWEDLWLQTRGTNSDFWERPEWGSLATLPNPIYLPLGRYRDGLDEERTHAALNISQRFRWKCVAHQNVLYHQSEQQIIQDVLTSIREGTPLKKLGLKLKRNSERRLKSPEEMNALFMDLPEAILATEEVRSRCTFEMSELRYQYPTEWIPASHTSQSYLEELCQEGIKVRYPRGASDAVQAQLLHELKLIRELRFADYFLTVYDIVAFARSRKILCQGRGSAANSVVCYLLGVTAIDPIHMNLLFERFISVERGEPPDIDVDFEHDRREEVIQYIYEKYGRHRAAMVSAVVTYRERSAFREVAKAFSIDVGTDSARAVQKKIRDSDSVSEVVKNKLDEVSGRLQSFPRHLSIHSGGFTLSHEPIDTIVPIEPATMEGRTIIQWDKYDLDILGLLKIDVLSLGMLSAIRRALDYTGKDLYSIPPDDPATYQMIQKADTIGVFQIESRAQMSMLPRLRPKNFYDLVVEIALVRPGPISGNMVHPYLRRRNGLEPVEYPHPGLIPILGKTYGVPIFQEQVMKMAVTLGGFSPGEADRLRRAIGAWRSSGSIDEMGKRLMLGFQKNGISQEYSQRIFDQIQGFAEYGFPESHSASFSILVYASSYLKCHYPAAFLCALLNSQPMGFYSPHSLVDDAKRHGVKVLPICIHESEWDCTMVGGAVRLGFRYVRSFEEAKAKVVIETRSQQRFKSFQDFVVRTQLGFKHLRSLAMAAAFEGVGLGSREALFQVLALHEGLFRQEEVQQNLFRTVELSSMSLQEKVSQDYQATGLSVRAHPTEFLRQNVRSCLQASMAAGASGLLSSNHLKADLKWTEVHSNWVKTQSRTGQLIKIMGLSVILQRPPTAKGTAFCTLEDEFGVLDLILHREIFQKYKELIREEAFLWVTGQVQRDERSGGAVQVIVKKVESIFRESFEIPHAPGAHAR